jgi:hypothetical protein
MNPPPLALGLTLCEKCIVEQRSNNITLVSVFTRLFVDDFPSRPERLAFFIVLVGGLGEGDAELVITRLETEDEVYRMPRSIRFPDRLAELRLAFHIRECSFPAPGAYDACVFVDGDPIARRKFSVAKRS